MRRLIGIRSDVPYRAKGEANVSLQKQLDRMREQFASTAPPEALSAMHRATEDLAASGIVDGVLKVGDPAPEFALSDQNGHGVGSAERLSKGPLVVGFYRGVW
jgi:hypothetical protein